MVAMFENFVSVTQEEDVPQVSTFVLTLFSAALLLAFLFLFSPLITAVNEMQ
jgi:hypothetical protein